MAAAAQGDAARGPRFVAVPVLCMIPVVAVSAGAVSVRRRPSDRESSTGRAPDAKPRSAADPRYFGATTADTGTGPAGAGAVARMHGARDAGEPPALPARLPSRSALHRVRQLGARAARPHL